MSHRRLNPGRFDPWGETAERAGLGPRRRQLLSRARGRVLDLGGGDGYNFPLYPDAVEHVTVLEPDLLSRGRLEARAGESKLPTVIRPLDVDSFEASAGSLDTVVSTFALCMVDDLESVLRRLRSWLAPGGELLFLEHTRAPGRRHWFQTLANPAWQLVAPGCHLDRDINAAVWAADFVIGSCDRFVVPMANPLLGAAVQGVARPRRGRPPLPHGAAAQPHGAAAQPHAYDRTKEETS